MTIEEVNNRLNAIKERRAEIASQSNEADADLDALINELTALNDEETNLKEQEEEMRKAEMKRRETRSRIAQGLLGSAPFETNSEKMTKEELRNDPRYIDAFADYIKKGSDKELRVLMTELSEVTANADKIPIPHIVEETIQTAWEKDSELASRANAVNYRGTLEIPYEKSATGAVIHKEGTPAPEAERLTIGIVKLSPDTIKKWIPITDELLAMKSDQFLTYIYAELTHQILLKLDQDIVADLLAETSADGLTSTEVTAPADAFSIFAADAELSDDAENAVIIMNKKLYYNHFMALKDTTGRPIYNIVSENGRPTHYINGQEVVFNSKLPATITAGQPYAVVGDMRGYTVNYIDGREPDILADPYTLATEDQVRYIGKLYVGHGITRPNYFVRLVAPA